jgi:hypothetical protein
VFHDLCESQFAGDSSHFILSKYLHNNHLSVQLIRTGREGKTPAPHRPQLSRLSALEIFVKSDTEIEHSMWEGYALIAAAFGVFVFTFYTVLVSKLLPSTGNALLDAIQADVFYCLLLPATIPSKQLQ